MKLLWAKTLREQRVLLPPKSKNSSSIGTPNRISSPERDVYKARKQIRGRSYSRAEEQKLTNSRFPLPFQNRVAHDSCGWSLRRWVTIFEGKIVPIECLKDINDLKRPEMTSKNLGQPRIHKDQVLLEPKQQAAASSDCYQVLTSAGRPLSWGVRTLSPPSAASPWSWTVRTMI